MRLIQLAFLITLGGCANGNYACMDNYPGDCAGRMGAAAALINASRPVPIQNYPVQFHPIGTQGYGQSSCQFIGNSMMCQQY